MQIGGPTLQTGLQGMRHPGGLSTAGRTSVHWEVLSHPVAGCEAVGEDDLVPAYPTMSIEGASSDRPPATGKSQNKFVFFLTKLHKLTETGNQNWHEV